MHSIKIIRWQMICLISFLFALTCAEAYLFAEISGPAVISGELKKWHKVTLTFEGPNTSESATPNPFTDYRLDVTFTNGNKTLIVPGYYAADGDAANSSAESGNKWRVHLAPELTGRWNYSVSFRQGDHIAVSSDTGTSVGFMDGSSGYFDIADTDKTGRDHRAKGRLQYVGEHYLQYAETGEYFLKQGADAPENLLAYADFDGNFKNDGIKDNLIKTWDAHVLDWQTGDPTWKNGKGKGLIGAINYLASEGMNAFSFLPMNIEGDDRNVFPYTDYNERTRFDVSKLDQWEIIFEHGDKLGMYLHFKTQETENDQLLDGGDLGVQRKLYYRELIARFSHHLALNWNLGEENTNTADQAISFAQYFHDSDPYQHNIVIHTYPGQKDLIYTPLLGSASKLTGASLQTNKQNFGNVFNDVKTWVDKSKVAGKKWVVACDEPGDAQHALMPDIDNPKHNNARKNGLWGTLMAGGAGNEWYFGYGHAHSDLTCQDFRSRDLWWDQCRYALEFFGQNNIPFWQMNNDNSLSSNSNDYCFYKADDTYIIYLKSGGNTSLDMTETSLSYQVKWYNPRTGGGLVNGQVTEVQGGTNVYLGEAPSQKSQDWVILIQTSGQTNLNQHPEVNAGPDQALTGTNPTTTLNGSVSDDGLPFGSILSSWEKVSGPGVVNFSDSTAAVTLADFSETGIYVLKLSANDGELSSEDLVEITVVSDNITVTNFVLVDSDRNIDLRILQDGDSINTAIYGSNLNIRAEVDGPVESVRFNLNGNNKLENVAPYAMLGDISGDYNVWEDPIGEHAIVATPFYADKAKGGAGISKSLQIGITTAAIPYQSVVQFLLMDAITNQKIRPLYDGANIDLSNEGNKLAIVAKVGDGVESVLFGLNDDMAVQTENVPPYALHGDRSGDFYSWTPVIGEYTLIATPYSADKASGAMGQPLEIKFTVND